MLPIHRMLGRQIATNDFRRILGMKLETDAGRSWKYRRLLSLRRLKFIDKFLRQLLRWNFLLFDIAIAGTLLPW